MTASYIDNEGETPVLDKLDSQGGHIAILLTIVVLGLVGCGLRIPEAHDVTILALGGLLVEIAVRVRHS